MKDTTNCLRYKQSKFNVNTKTRLSQDKNYIDLHNKTIAKNSIYQTRNFHDCKCEAAITKDISLQQPSMVFRDGYGWTSIDGCNIDNDSNLRNARNLTNERCINQLFERPHNTTPYMGRGIGNVDTENRLMPGEATFQNRPCNNLAGIYIDRFTPLIPCIKDTIQNPNNIVQEMSDRNWVRGGQPSRQIIRNKDYLKKCGFKYNGKYWIKN